MQPGALVRGRWRDWLLLVAVLVATDVAMAQLLKRVYPDWDPVRGALARARERAATERKYRAPSPVYHHDLVRNTAAVGSWGLSRYDVRTNSLGFRDATVREISLRPTRHRILLIGDSFTEGVGLDFAKTYAGIITRELAARETEVLNAGVVSYSPAIYYAKVRHLLEVVGLEFDELVVFLDISDIEDESRFYRLVGGQVVGLTRADSDSLEVIGYLGARAAAGSPQRGGLKQLLRDNSVTLHALDAMKDRNRMVRGLAIMRGSPRSRWTVSDSAFQAYGRLGLENATENMNRLASLLRDKGIALTVSVYPWPTQVLLDSANSLQVRHWRSWTGHVGATFVDLFPPFFADPDRAATVRAHFIPGDVHFNEAGNALIARAFLEAYRSRIQDARRRTPPVP